MLVLNKITKKIHIYKVDLTNEIPSLVEVRIIDNVMKYKSHSSARSLCFIQSKEAFNTMNEIIFYKTNDDWVNYYINESIQIDSRNYRQEGDSNVIDLCCDHNSRLYFLTVVYNTYVYNNYLADSYNYKLYVTTSNVNIGVKKPLDLDNITIQLNQRFGNYTTLDFTQDVDDKSLFVLEDYIAPYTSTFSTPHNILVNGSLDNGFTFDALEEYQYDNSESIARAIVDGSYNMIRDSKLYYPFKLSSFHKYNIEIRLQDNNMSIDIQHVEALSIGNINNVIFRLDTSSYGIDGETDFRIAGSFNSWVPTPLVLNSEDGIYEYTLQLLPNDIVEYKFLVGGWSSGIQENYLPGTPGTISPHPWATNRVYNYTDADIPADGGDIIVDTAIWTQM